jgi:hypothetical protein
MRQREPDPKPPLRQIRIRAEPLTTLTLPLREGRIWVRAPARRQIRGGESVRGPLPEIVCTSLRRFRPSLKGTVKIFDSSACDLAIPQNSNLEPRKPPVNPRRITVYSRCG